MNAPDFPGLLREIREANDDAARELFDAAHAAIHRAVIALEILRDDGQHEGAAECHEKAEELLTMFEESVCTPAQADAAWERKRASLPELIPGVREALAALTIYQQPTIKPVGRQA